MRSSDGSTRPCRRRTVRNSWHRRKTSSEYLDSNRAFPFDFSREPFSAAVQISLPIFNGFTRERHVERARVEVENTRHRLRQEELRLQKTEVATAYQNLRTAYRTVELEERNLELAKRAA